MAFWHNGTSTTNRRLLQFNDSNDTTGNGTVEGDISVDSEVPVMTSSISRHALQTFVAPTYGGNTPSQYNSTNLYPNPDPTINSERSNPTVKYVIISVLLMAFVIVGGLVYWFVRNRRRQQPAGELPGMIKDDEERRILPPSRSKKNDRKTGDNLPQPLSSAMIKKVTGNFKEKIGEGGFGEVYAGNLHGRKIAVKRLKKELKVSAENFGKEMKILVKVRHRNLVKLVAYCSDGKHKYLCFEFLSGGSLDKLLYEHNKSTKLLDWSQRYHMIKEICNGLRYLHEDSDNEEKIIHMDLKAANVLIDRKQDGNLVVKIADFGLSRLLQSDQTSIYTTSPFVGTKFYLPPECFQRKSKISEKVDIYCYGMLLVEMITGWCASDRTFPDVQVLIEMAQHALSSRNVTKLLDGRLGVDACNMPQVLNCIAIANDCLNNVPEKRPDTKDIAERLARC